MRFRRNAAPWLIVMGAALAIALLSGTAPPLVAVTLIALFGAGVALSLINAAPSRLLEQSRSSLAAARMSSDAREASVRARRGGGFSSPDMTLLDIGLIAVQTGDAGMNMRRTRDVTLDDDGVRPFITLNVLPAAADRRSLVRFELRDGVGKVRYVHEMRPYLRAGDMNLLADHQLPLYANTDNIEPGDWDLRVSLDGNTIAEHVFTVSPSIEDRFSRARRLAVDGEAPAKSRLSEVETDAPMSLEDLLRGQADNGQKRAGR
ncbi:MAG: hypothetical protein UZ15_CFX003001196 [Chloroflexi bacterium OLB15]|nr:MAG: hypothetical protein UZ15_CFX003001196 [Chloroflexi bacterium OLB15]